MFIRTALAAATLSAAAFTPAFADTQADIELCQAALTAEAPNADFTFKRKSGASVAKLKFEMTTQDGETRDVVCKVKRGEVIDLDMGA
ncbi:MAG: hypothetical protein AAGA69_08560 [Pseudomonadota bacterium]